MTTKRILIYVLTLASLVVMYWVFLIVLSLAPQFSGLPYALTKAFAGILTLKLVDDIVLSEIETTKRIKEDGTAYSIYLLGYALIIALALQTA